MQQKWHTNTLSVVCFQSLGSKQHIPEARLIKHLDRGGLFKPTTSVMKVCLETEKSIVRMLIETNGKLPQGKGIPNAIATAILSGLATSEVFSELNEHSLQFRAVKTSKVSTP